MTADKTFVHLSEENRLQHLINDLKAYLKSRLTIKHINGKPAHYWCGFDHDPRNPEWKPWQHLEVFCIERGYNPGEVADMIGTRYARKLNCECEIFYDPRQVRRDALKRMYGVDFDSEEVELVDELQF